MEKINITKDGLEFVNDAGRKVVLRTNHAATADQYLDLPALAGTITTNTTSTDTDEKSKVSSNDTTAGYLNGKLVAGSGITLTENNNGGDETLTIAASGGGGSYAEYYDITLADAENTTAETTVFSFVVPANTWADGQGIVMDFAFDILNNTGSAQTAYAALNGTTWTGNDLTGSINSSSSIRRGYVRALALRSGSGVIMIGKYLSESGYTVSPSNFGDISSMVESGWLGTAGSYQAYPNDTSVTFTSNITITFKYQWPTASPDLYFRPRWGSAYKTGKGAAS